MEIARALSFGARLIVLDEPTAQLDARGIQKLFTKVRELRERGVAFLFISHHLQEVYELCSAVTVYRDARHVLSADVADLSKDDLVAAMTGDAAKTATTWHAGRNAAHTARSDPVLRTERLSLDKAFESLDLEVAPGEVLGVAGAAASGTVALGEILVGMRSATSGSVVVHGRTVRPGSVPDALEAGIGYIPEDRHRQGLVETRSVAENATLTVAGRLGPWGTVLPSRTRAFARSMIEVLDIKTTGPEQPVTGLSGGNQQKVVVARALARDPDVLVAVRPTAGVDVRSKDSLLGWIVLGVASLLAAFAGILCTGHYGSVAADQGNGWIFNVFAAAVIGGVSLKGGRGTVFGALTGVLTLQLVVNVMTLAGVPPEWDQFLNGAITIVALIVSRFASGEKQD